MTEKITPAKGSFLNKIIPCRYILAVLGSIALAIIYGLKVNLSVAIVGMVNHTALELQEGKTAKNNSLTFDSDVVCIFNDTDTTNTSTPATVEDGPFTWSSTLQGMILSSYFWGYIVAQVPGGRIAELVSAKWVMFFSVAINVVCTILTPLAAKWHYVAMLAMRIGEGIGGGVTFPAMHVMLAHWAPPAERSVMSSIVYSGSALGTVISMLLAGVIAGSLGWEAVFYIMGGLSAIWMLLWVVLIADSPEKLSLISEEERTLIVGALNAEAGGKKKEEHPPVPWKSIFLSTAFWAILVAHTCSNWGWYMVLIELPLYMKMILKFKIAENAVLTAVPFLCMWIFSILLSKALDTMRAKHIISTTFARKTATLIASVIPTLCFVTLCYIGCQRSLSVFLMTVAVMSIGGMYCGFLSNHIDIAPNYAGTLMAITNTVATLPGIIVPVFVGSLTGADPTMRSWKIIFWVTAGLYLIEILAYALFGSGEVQKWNNPITKQNVEIQPLKSPQSPDSTKPGYESTKTT
ncbi:hypothetical protein Trydic_g3270 [Trypoxylus dichotomus]